MKWNPFHWFTSEEPTFDAKQLAQYVVERTSPEEFRKFLKAPTQDVINTMVHTSEAVLLVLGHILQELEEGLPPHHIFHLTMAVDEYEEQMASIDPLQEVHKEKYGHRCSDISVVLVMSKIAYARKRARSFLAKMQAAEALPDLAAEKRVLLSKKMTLKQIFALLKPKNTD